jgi:hypothetical protein
LVQRENLPEVIQSIAFPGAGDHGFWNDFSDAPKTDAARAQVVQNMLDHQIALLKSHSSNQNADKSADRMMLPERARFAGHESGCFDSADAARHR